ncbi:putative outer membrane protein iml2 mitochondrial tetratricopeptide repeat protein 39 protein [Neofusicoccum parvum UCRNP2]|uniref:Inclusion body clearance protein IML2 n=1 Tax=Botryosphaeria parva (strain UCR-NP2) TaxID=1287680 RepID=R1EG06_BOTPV|nr:putative outer membrane protein iml2 mitochondrial tetratricopeptide repeat protein 39 protein [Neofusicoccum parvum UCRNP2]
MCYGTLMLIISMIPPAFATLLKIVGFKGDRDRGLAMLWQATKFDNIYGGLAGLIILSYYNGMLGFCDIVPSAGQEGSYPREQCRSLLADMRARYPKSSLWLVEEARMLASERKLEAAIDLLAVSSASSLKQVEALHWFERALDLMYAHRYVECAQAFQKCVKLNNWSHGLYYYIAACSHVELYRIAVVADDAAGARENKAEAERLLALVPQHTGKKRFMARQLPFDVFVNRKLAKWNDERGAAGSIVDAVGVSPIEEVVYFWNGYKRMRPDHLALSLDALDRSTPPADEPLDERCIRSLLRATALRNLGRVREAKEILLAEVLCHEWAQFKGGNKDNWTLPAGCYEMAACLWQDGGSDVVAGDERGEERLRECGSWVERVARWGEGYDLDAR